MKRLAVGFACVLLCTAAGNAAQPQPSPTPSATLSLGGSSEQLTNGKGTWQSTYLSYVKRTADRSAIYASISNNQRFGKTDPLYTAGINAHLSANTLLGFEVSVSPTHAVLPQNELTASLEHRLAAGYGYVLGLDHRTFSGLDVQAESLLVDRYWRTFRAAYKITSTQLSNVAGTSINHSVLLTHYYGSDGVSSVTFSANAGREAESIGTGVVVSSVSGESLGGTHWLSQWWGATWQLGSVRQGSFYTRRGVQVGIIRRL